MELVKYDIWRSVYDDALTGVHFGIGIEVIYLVECGVSDNIYFKLSPMSDILIMNEAFDEDVVGYDIWAGWE